MVDKYALYLDALQRAGLRLTAPRREICTWLAETDTHPTPYQVFARITDVHPEISRATVYNTLNTLQQLGVIVEVSFGSNHTHYDTNPEPHINLICMVCHSIEDVDVDDAFRQMVARAAEEAGFTQLSSHADVLGICRDCLAAGKTSALHAQPMDEES